MSQHTNNSLPKAFSESLISARGDRSQAEFARFLGIPSQQTYQRYEGGLIPSGKVLHKIAGKLGITIDSLLTLGTQEEAEAAGKKVLAADVPPWGKELEENTQMIAAINMICHCLTSQQLTQLIQEIIGTPTMSDKAKVFWVSIFGQRLRVLIDMDEFSKLAQSGKVNARRAENYRRRADPEATKDAS